MICATAVLKPDECRECSDQDASPCWLLLVAHHGQEMVKWGCNCHLRQASDVCTSIDHIVPMTDTTGRHKIT